MRYGPQSRDEVVITNSTVFPLLERTCSISFRGDILVVSAQQIVIN